MFEQELNRAMRELVFVRSSYDSGPSNSPRAISAAAPNRTGSESGREPPKGGSGVFHLGSIALLTPTPTGRFGRFTLPRYNRAVEGIKNRQRLLTILTLALSCAIGVTIVTVTLLYTLSNAPIWMALLPAIWLIPVPFFVLAFRGSRRVLTRNQLTLPGDL